MIKQFTSPNYSFKFNTNTGCFARWGSSYEDDPQLSAFGPEIADIEISTICSHSCQWCYKGNTAIGKNMSLETFKKVFEVLPKDTLTQIAFGIGDIDANPDMFPIFHYTRDNGVIPNVTINGHRLNQEIIKHLALVCGAVAVSNYSEDTYYAVSGLVRSGLKQVNIHQLLSSETYDKCLKVMNDYLVDSRLNGLNAIVFLSLKQKGRGKQMTPVSYKKLEELSRFAIDHNIPIGFDSCSANHFLEISKNIGREDLHIFIEPCESSLFSAYINVNGDFHPCSFLEGVVDPINIIGKNFIKDVWFNEQTITFRNKLLANKRNCPIYKILD